MAKAIFYGLLTIFIVLGGTFLFYKIVFFPPYILENRETKKIEFKNKLPVIEKNKIYKISQLKSLPENSIVIIEGKIVQLNKDKDLYTGHIQDISGKIRFVLKKKVVEKNEGIAEIIDDAVYLDVSFSFLVKVKKDYVEVLDIF